MSYGYREDKDGVIVIFADINGVEVDICDIWFNPLVDKAGLHRKTAKGIQKSIASELCAALGPWLRENEDSQ